MTVGEKCWWELFNPTMRMFTPLIQQNPVDKMIWKVCDPRWCNYSCYWNTRWCIIRLLLKCTVWENVLLLLMVTIPELKVMRMIPWSCYWCNNDFTEKKWEQGIGESVRHDQDGCYCFIMVNTAQIDVWTISLIYVLLLSYCSQLKLVEKQQKPP